MAEEKKEKQVLEEPIPVKEIILMTILSLEGKAWAYLGLTAHPETQKPKKDLNEARLAIDSIEALYKLLEPALTSDEKRDIQVRLTNLRLNFVRE
ncbi:MAG: DUF1844 domain-containing protein [candidate division WOR-3 bacterium]|nr:DUF1844 domain-containing protein [candidate division WOR-3 bacterium]